MQETNMHEKQKTQMSCLRLNPENRLCPQTDSVSIRKFRVASREQMGFRVVDDFCEEHIQ
ncbi:MAG: hypothetical protein KHY76_10255 [Butyricicoccus pullicaecorum]|nr:hypothetical protein [Butyricicoccus pullicaecorum]